MKIYAVVIGKMRGPLSTVLQNCHFWSAKLPLLECKTATFGVQNCHFWNAKRTVLECKTHRFRNHPNLPWNLISLLCRLSKPILYSVCKAKIIKNSFIACLEGVKKWGLSTL